MTAWPLQTDAASFYGDPVGDGGLDRQWYAESIVAVGCPWRILPWNGSPIRHIAVHRLCADSLTRVLDGVWEAVGHSQAEVHRLHYDVYSGAFAYRSKRRGTGLSMHAYGAAIDWDAPHNAQGDEEPFFTGDCPLVVAFEREGWVWGGRWSADTVDGMHFQAARVNEVDNDLQV